MFEEMPKGEQAQEVGIEGKSKEESNIEQELDNYVEMVETYDLDELGSELNSIVSFLAENSGRRDDPEKSTVFETYERKLAIIEGLIEKKSTEDEDQIENTDADEQLAA